MKIILKFSNIGVRGYIQTNKVNANTSTSLTFNFVSNMSHF